MFNIRQHPTVQEALLYEQVPDGKVRCSLCERRCLVSPSQKGYCNTRLNVKGKLYTLVYGDPPVQLTGSERQRLIDLIAATPIGWWRCMLRGMLKALEIANAAGIRNARILLVSDGRPVCASGETDPDRIFSQIMAANVLDLPIDTIYVGPQSGDDWTIGKPLLERLSEATGGEFRISS